MLHEDMKDFITTEEIISLALAEYAPMFAATARLDVVVSYDDGGKTLDFHIEGEENATFLRKEVPNSYNGYRTIVIYSPEPDYELGTERV